MYIIFGRKMCSACEEAKKNCKKDRINYKYIDLDNMSEEERHLAIYHEALKEGRELPYKVNIDINNDYIWDSIKDGQ